MEVKTYQVTAKRWARGWELHIDGIGVTQSHGMRDAEPMVRDYIALALDVDPNSFAVEITPQLGSGLDEEIRDARAATAEAATTLEAAAKRARQTARRLKNEKGLSGRDIAAILGVSPQRVSQLLNS